MIFTQAPFLVLFVITAALFFAGPRAWRRAVLAISGLLFYAWQAAGYLPLVMGMILATAWTSGRAGAWINAAVLVGVMAWFKGHAATVAVMPGAPQHIVGLGPSLMPLGVSFLAFELIHVAIERRKGRLDRPPLVSLAAFALFAPCRIAGPIKRFPAFDRSIDEASWSASQLYRGSVRALQGLLKKVFLADTLALAVPQLHFATSTASAWLALLAYSWYLYLDFSAYSDIAIGLSSILGVKVPENFRFPYASRNIREFWTRWHMSFSSWLGDYVFLPVSKRLTLGWPHLPPRGAAMITYLVTFLICGLWHGLAWHFVAWGLFHGILLGAFAEFAARRSRDASRSAWSWLTEWGARLATFLVVTWGWLLFALEWPRALRLAALLVGWTR